MRGNRFFGTCFTERHARSRRPRLASRPPRAKPSRLLRPWLRSCRRRPRGRHWLEPAREGERRRGRCGGDRGERGLAGASILRLERAVGSPAGPSAYRAHGRDVRPGGVLAAACGRCREARTRAHGRRGVTRPRPRSRPRGRRACGALAPSSPRRAAAPCRRRSRPRGQSRSRAAFPRIPGSDRRARQSVLHSARRAVPRAEAAGHGTRRTAELQDAGRRCTVEE